MKTNAHISESEAIPMSIWSSLVLAAVLCAVLATAAYVDDAVKIGSRLEPFVDDFLIQRMDNAELTLHHPVVRETVFRFDAPCEGPTSAYVTVFRDGDRYRMYYRGSTGDSGHQEVTCTAESTDGINWTRPKLGIHECAGTRDNNIVWISTGGHAFVPFRDTNPSVGPEELYKAVAPTSGDGRTSVLNAYVSPDGYHWRQLGAKPIITDGKFDSQNLAFRDAGRGEYVCYFRDFRDGVRDIKRATSKDFVNWSAPEWLAYEGAPKEQLYTNAVQPYFRAPHIYVGFPKRFLPDRKAIESHSLPGVSDGVFMTSRDGINFHRWQEAFYRPGPEPENWTDRNNMAAWGMFELKPGEISLYYSCHYRHPGSGLVRATIRTDGFVSVSADSQGGEMITNPLVFEGKELVINYSTSAAGGIRVEVQGSDGKPIPGYALDECPIIYGDEIERVVKWKSGSDVSSLAGKPVRLRFELKDADLYAIRFRD